jgi:hypothetical protein
MNGKWPDSCLFPDIQPLNPRMSARFASLQRTHASLHARRTGAHSL